MPKTKEIDWAELEHDIAEANTDEVIRIMRLCIAQLELNRLAEDMVDPYKP